MRGQKRQAGVEGTREAGGVEGTREAAGCRQPKSGDRIKSQRREGRGGPCTYLRQYGVHSRRRAARRAPTAAAGPPAAGERLPHEAAAAAAAAAEGAAVRGASVQRVGPGARPAGPGPRGGAGGSPVAPRAPCLRPVRLGGARAPAPAPATGRERRRQPRKHPRARQRRVGHQAGSRGGVEGVQAVEYQHQLRKAQPVLHSASVAYRLSPVSRPAVHALGLRSLGGKRCARTLDAEPATACPGAVLGRVFRVRAHPGMATAAAWALWSVTCLGVKHSRA